MGKLIVALVVLLAILHQDFWLWDNTTLVLGFLPAGLAYHVFYSIICGLVWMLAVKFAWPEHIEKMADLPPDATDGANRP